MSPADLVEEGLVTVREAAAFLALSRSTLWKLMDAGELPFVILRGKGERGRSARRLPKVAIKRWAAGLLQGA